MLSILSEYIGLSLVHRVLGEVLPHLAVDSDCHKSFGFTLIYTKSGTNPLISGYIIGKYILSERMERIYFPKIWYRKPQSYIHIHIYIYNYIYIYIYVYRTGVSGYHNFDKNMLSILSESMESICFPKFWYPETPVLYTYTYIYVYRTGLFGYHNFGKNMLSILSESMESICFPKFWYPETPVLYTYTYIYVYRTGLFGYHNFGKNMLSILLESIYFRKVYTFGKYILSESIYFPKEWKV